MAEDRDGYKRHLAATLFADVLHDNVDTDVIIPARYLNTSDKKELASHCMEDLDKSFAGRVQKGDIMAVSYTHLDVYKRQW